MICSVIGSGCSALSCGIMLAQKGYKVRLYEQSNTIAPTLNGFSRNNQYYDTGVHCLGGVSPGEPLHNYFRFLGIEDNLEIQVNKASPFIFSSPDGTWTLPQTYSAVRECLTAEFPDESTSIDNFLSLVKRLSHDFQYGNIIAEDDVVVAEKPLQQVLDSFFRSRKLQWKLTALLSLFCGLGTKETSLGFYASSVGTYFMGSAYIFGGGKALTAALCNKLLELGGSIHTKKLVTQIEIDEDKKCTGLHTEDGEFYPSDVVIATCHPAHLTALLPTTALRPIRNKYYQSLESTHSFVALYGQSPHSIALPESGVISDVDIPVTTMNAQGTADKRSPSIMFFRQAHDHGSSITIIAPTSYRNWSSFSGDKPFARKHGYKEHKKRISQQILDKIGLYYPELVDHITIDSISSPLTMRDYCNMPQGAIYGCKASNTIQQPLPILPIHNLFLSGQALVGPGVLGAMTSAAMTVESILQNPDFAKEIHRAA